MDKYFLSTIQKYIDEEYNNNDKHKIKRKKNINKKVTNYNNKDYIMLDITIVNNMCLDYGFNIPTLNYLYKNKILININYNEYILSRESWAPSYYRYHWDGRYFKFFIVVKYNTIYIFIEFESYYYFTLVKEVYDNIINKIKHIMKEINTCKTCKTCKTYTLYIHYKIISIKSIYFFYSIYDIIRKYIPIIYVDFFMKLNVQDNNKYYIVNKYNNIIFTRFFYNYVSANVKTFNINDNVKNVLFWDNYPIRFLLCNNLRNIVLYKYTFRKTKLLTNYKPSDFYYVSCNKILLMFIKSIIIYNI